MLSGEVRLSSREREVLQLSCEGFVVKQIALQLHLSQHTVREYLRRAKRKLSVSNNVEAASRFAIACRQQPGHDSGSVAPRVLLDFLRLSEFERTVALLVCGGLTDRAIAKTTGRSLSSVRSAVGELYQRTGARSRPALAARIALLPMGVGTSLPGGHRTGGPCHPSRQ